MIASFFLEKVYKMDYYLGTKSLKIIILHKNKFIMYTLGILL